MSRHHILAAATMLVLMAMLGPASALAINYNESIDGDLSGDPGNPTSLGTLGLGTHTLTASSGGGDFDLLTLSIASGNELQSLVLDSYVGGTSFVGLQSGATWTEGLGFAISPGNLLGWTHFSGALVSTDILDNIGEGSSASGFTPPLPEGDYTFLLQDTGGVVSYSMTFTVVPEPASMALAAFGFAGLVAIAWRRRKGNC